MGFLHAMQLLDPAIVPHPSHVPTKHDRVYKARKTLDELKKL